MGGSGLGVSGLARSRSQHLWLNPDVGNVVFDNDERVARTVTQCCAYFGLSNIALLNGEVLDPSVPLQHEELSNLAHAPTSIRSPLRVAAAGRTILNRANWRVKAASQCGDVQPRHYFRACACFDDCRMDLATAAQALFRHSFSQALLDLAPRRAWLAGEARRAAPRSSG
jgi:hypothetical protein